MPSKSRHGLLQFVSFQPVHELHVAFHRPVLFKYGEILAEEHVPHSAVDGIRYPLRSSRKRKRISWLALNFMSADVLVAFSRATRRKSGLLSEQQRPSFKS
jgi:hypothetical protein